MDFIDILVIFWIGLTLFVAFLLCATIVKYISGKATASLTIVNLIYKDVIIYINLFCLSVYIGIILCILSNNSEHSIDFRTSVILSLFIYTFFHNIAISLSISGTLRLITLTKLSEEFGLQMLGPDSLAIYKVRFVSFFLSITLVVYAIIFQEFYPTTIDLFYGIEDANFSKRVINMEVMILFNIPQACVVIVNSFTKLYSMWLNIAINKKLRRQNVQIFLVSTENNGDNIVTKKEKGFALPMNYVLAIILTFPLLLLFSQLSDRHSRLYFVEPTFLMNICCIVPLCIVLKHKKMRNILMDFFPKMNFKDLLNDKKICFWSSSVAVHPE